MVFLLTRICNRFSVIAIEKSVSERKITLFQQNARQKKDCKRFKETCIRNQLKISREIEASCNRARPRLARENEVLISMETSNHKDRSAPSLYVLK